MLAAREAARAAGGGIVEERFRARAAAHPIAAGIARDELPFLAGYVVAALKPGAEPVLLSHLDDPILAAWRFGLGRVAVYTADLRSPWSAGVRRWPAFDAFWLQTARWIGKRAADRGLRASIVDRPDGVRLVLDADDVSGEPIDGWNVRATVRGAGGRTENVELASSSPGRYEAPLATASPGAYVVSIVARAPGGATERRAIKAFYWSANRERRATGADMRALGQMARATGGRMLGPADNPFDEPRPRAYRDVWNVLAAAALVLFLLDVALRRGFLTRGRSSPERAVASQAAA
jgi:hypothetical protein